jgi:predicted small metal-binding protein
VLAGMKGPKMSQERPKSKNIACGDVVPGCAFTATAATEEELIAQVAAHAAHDHGVKEITPELAAKVKAAIRTQ